MKFMNETVALYLRMKLFRYISTYFFFSYIIYQTDHRAIELTKTKMYLLFLNIFNSICLFLLLFTVHIIQDRISTHLQQCNILQIQVHSMMALTCGHRVCYFIQKKMYLLNI